MAYLTPSVSIVTAETAEERLALKAELDRLVADPVGCVTKGAAMLDEGHAGWHRLINVSELDLNSAFECVFGQLYGYWGYGLERFNLRGIAITAHGICGNAERLKEAWTDAITARRLADHEREIASTTREVANV